MKRLAPFPFLAVMALLALGLGLFTGCSDSKSASGLLTINPAPNLHVESAYPIYVAFRDGNGAWQRLQASGNGGYSAPVSDPDGRYTVLMVMNRYMQGSTRVTQGYGDVIIVHGTLQETPSLWYGMSDNDFNGSPYIVSGSISNAPADPRKYLEVRMGQYGMWSGSNMNTSYQLYNPPQPGTHDLVAYIRSSIAFSPERFFVQRNIAMTGDLIRNIDFSATVAAEYSQLTLTGGEWGDTYAYVYGITANGTEVGASEYYANQRNIPFVILPAPASGDLYRVYGQVTSGDTWAQVTSWHGSPMDIVVPLPEQFTGVTVDYSGAAPIVGGLEYSADAYGAAKGYLVDFWGPDDNDAWHNWRCYLTPGALRGATSFSLPAPGSLPDWNDAWSLPMSPDPERSWRATAAGGAIAVAELLNLYVNGGSRYNITHDDGTALYSAICQSRSDDRSAPLTRNDRRGMSLFGY